MNVLGKFESAMQGIVEGSFGRVFRSGLHEVEVSRKLERAMDQNLSISLGRRIAPNVYDIYLGQKDYDKFGAYSRSLVQRLQDGLINVARMRGYLLTSRPVLLFHVDPHIITGQMRIEARLAEPQAGASGQDGGQAIFDETRELSPDEARQLAQQVAQTHAEQDALPQAWLTLRRPNGGGQVYQLDRPVIHIGRHVSNDIVVNDRRVSRYHAEIRYERGQFVLYDLGSLNGVGVNGVLTHQPTTLRNNDQIAVGNHDFIFQRR